MNSLALLLSIAYLITVICCVIDVFRTRKASGGAAVWLLVVLFVPLGAIAYILFSETDKEKKQKQASVWDADAKIKARANSGDL